MCFSSFHHLPSLGPSLEALLNRLLVKGDKIVYSYLKFELKKFEYFLSPPQLSKKDYFQLKQLSQVASLVPYQARYNSIVGKGVHTPPPLQINPPFLRFPPFQKSKMSPPFIGLSGKQKNCCNQFVYNFKKQKLDRQLDMWYLLSRCSSVTV